MNVGNQARIGMARVSRRAVRVGNGKSRGDFPARKSLRAARACRTTGAVFIPRFPMRPDFVRSVVPVFLLSLQAVARGAETTEAPPAKLLGFTEAHAAAQVALEKKFDAQISA